jgi:hypothetical protein
MRRAIGLLLVLTLPLGCASTAPRGAPEARSAPQASTSPPSAYPLPPVLPPPPLAPAPQVSPRIDNEEKAVRDVNARLARAGQIVAQVDATKLGNEQQEMLSGLKNFISKAADALQARDIPRAQVLADKASRLADDLVLAVKSPRPIR